MFSQVLEARSSKSRCQRGSVLPEAPGKETQHAWTSERQPHLLLFLFLWRVKGLLPTDETTWSHSWSPQVEASWPSGVMETTDGQHARPTHVCPGSPHTWPACLVGHLVSLSPPRRVSMTVPLLTGSGFNMRLLPSGRPAPPVYGRKSSQAPPLPPLPPSSILWPHIRDTREWGGGHAGLGCRTGRQAACRSITEAKPCWPTTSLKQRLAKKPPVGLEQAGRPGAREPAPLQVQAPAPLPHCPT